MTDWSLIVPHREVTRVPAERVFGLPHPRLAGHVLTYTGHDYRRMDPMPWRMTPLAALTVIVDLERPSLRRLPGGQDLPESPVLGLRDRPLALEQGGASRGIFIALTPLGAHALFGMPLRDLANTATALADLLGPEAERLTDRVATTQGWSARFRVLDDYLTARLARGPRLADPVWTVWRRLLAAPRRVGALADDIGWTRQHLATRFREDVGLAPGTVARITRLHRAASLLAAADRLSIADIAQAGGYADQPHLNRDFRTLTGCTPAEFRPA